MANTRKRKNSRRAIDSRGSEQYYMNGANARVVHESDQQPLFAHKLKGQDMRKHSRAKDQPWPKLPIFTLIFVLALLVAGEFALVQNMGLSVSRAQSELEEIQAQNEVLRNQVSELSHLGMIEEKAREDLGMVKPGQVVTYTGTALPPGEGAGEGSLE